jgi:hypothetical protein
MNLTRQIKAFSIVLVCLVFFSFLGTNLLLPQPSSSSKLVILYYNPFNMQVNESQFPAIISYASRNHFNTLMLIVYAYNHPLLNSSEVSFFANYSSNRGITFVPSFYIVSLSDRINTTGFKWINLDMESLTVLRQVFFYEKVSRNVPLVSVTSMYGQQLLFEPKLNIVETYFNTPLFWFYQLWFPHSGVVCSVSVARARSQIDFDTEFEYCLGHSRGVMVFDYWNMLKSNLTVP